MELNAKMLWEILGSKTDVTLLGQEPPEHSLHFPCFYSGSPETLVRGGLYLTEAERLPPARVPVVWVTWGRAPQVIPSGESVLHFPRDREPAAVLNRIHQVFLEFQLWEEETGKILREDNSVKRLIEASEKLLCRPLCAVDASLNHIGYNTAFLNMGFATFFPDEKTKQDASASPLFCKPQGYTMAPLGNREGSMGALYMLENGSPFTYTEKILFRQLTGKINQALHNTTMMSGVYRNSFKQNMISCFATGQAEGARLFESLHKLTEFYN